jgi:hypothetical protein
MIDTFRADLERIERETEKAKLDKAKYEERLVQLKEQEKKILKEFENLGIKPEGAVEWIQKEEKKIAEEIRRCKEILKI